MGFIIISLEIAYISLPMLSYFFEFKKFVILE
jgi:hypothetical protein